MYGELIYFCRIAKIKNYQAAYEPWKIVIDNCPKLNVATYQFGERILKILFRNLQVER